LTFFVENVKKRTCEHFDVFGENRQNRQKASEVSILTILSIFSKNRQKATLGAF